MNVVLRIIAEQINPTTIANIERKEKMRLLHQTRKLELGKMKQFILSKKIE